MKTAGTPGTPAARAFDVPMAQNRPMVRASRAVMTTSRRVKIRSSSMPPRAAATATSMSQLLESAAGVTSRNTSRRRPPPSPVAVPMMATPSRSSRRSRKPAANMAPWRLPMLTARRSAQSGMVRGTGSMASP